MFKIKRNFEKNWKSTTKLSVIHLKIKINNLFISIKRDDGQDAKRSETLEHFCQPFSLELDPT